MAGGLTKMALPGRLSQPLVRGRVFRYGSWAVDAERGVLTCGYSLDGREFTERVTLGSGPSALAAAGFSCVALLAAGPFFDGDDLVQLGHHGLRVQDRVPGMLTAARPAW